MQIDSGIGRAGYRLLAFMFLLMGCMGLAVAWMAVAPVVDRFFLMGIGLAMVGLIGLTGFSFLLSTEPRITRQRSAPKPKAAPKPESDLDFEYGAPTPSELRPLAERAGSHTPAPSVAAPVEMVAIDDPAPIPMTVPAPMPPAPSSAPPAPARPTPPPSARAEMRERYTQEAPLVREILTGSGQQVTHERVPEVTAKRVPAGAKPGVAPPGTTMGRCGSCSTVIYAPTTRPLRLRCPSCAKVTLLK